MNQILAEGGFAPEWVMLRLLPSFFSSFFIPFDADPDPDQIRSALEKKDQVLDQVMNIYLILVYFQIIFLTKIVFTFFQSF